MHLVDFTSSWAVTLSDARGTLAMSVSFPFWLCPLDSRYYVVWNSWILSALFITGTFHVARGPHSAWLLSAALQESLCVFLLLRSPGLQADTCTHFGCGRALFPLQENSDCINLNGRKRLFVITMPVHSSLSVRCFDSENNQLWQ